LPGREVSGCPAISASRGDHHQCSAHGRYHLLGGDGGGIVIPPARRLAGAPMPQRTRTGFHASGPCSQANAMVVVIRRHADRVSKLATARRPMKPLASRSNAPAGHWWEPTKNSNPTNHMHLGRRRCFYLAVLKSGIRSATPRSVGQSVSSGKTGERRRADAKFVPGFQTAGGDRPRAACRYFGREWGPKLAPP